MITKKQQRSFLAKATALPAHATAGDNYPAVYLRHLLQHLPHYLDIYTHVLNKAVSLSGKPLSEIRLADIGAGNGLLGFFALHCGCKEVFLNDIDPAFITASKKLAVQFDISAANFIEGDTDAVVAYFSGNEGPDVVVGTDVIEHVYRLDAFLSALSSMSSLRSMVFTTGSNPANYLKIRQLRKIQFTDEYLGGMPGDYLLYGGEPMKPFLEIRKDIIRQLDDFDENTLSKLAEATRGMKQPDIEKAVKTFMQTGVLPPPPADAFNTCNPFTGSWSERVLPFNVYREHFSAKGYRLHISPGFYNGKQATAKGKLLRLVNLLMPLAGFYLAPFIFVSASREKH